MLGVVKFDHTTLGYLGDLITFMRERDTRASAPSILRRDR